MKDHSQASHAPSATSKHDKTERLFLVMPQDSKDGAEISFLALWNVLWQGKWLIMAVTAIFSVLSAVYALTATEWYRSDVLLAPVGQESQGLAGALGNLGALAGLAGIDTADNSTAESIAILKSDDFTRAFIEDQQLLPVLLSDKWDSEAKRWTTDDPADQPDIRDAVTYFDENVRRVSIDSTTDLVTLSIEWTSPAVAAEWAGIMVAQLNDRMRQRALEEAKYNVEYLETQLTATNVASLRQSISNLLEKELQKLMLANGREEFAFRVIDSAQIPKKPARPKRLLIVAVATVVGGLLGFFIAFLRSALSSADSWTTAERNGTG